MATTSVREIELMLPGSFGKETLSNDGMENLALGISGTATIPLTGDLTLTDTQARHFVLILTGVLTAHVNVTVPADPRVYIVDNRTTGAFNVTLFPSAGGGVAVVQGARTLVYCDGSNVYPVASGTGGGGGSGAPTDATYLVGTAHALLSAERVVTDTATVTWDLAATGQARAQIPDGAVTYAKLQDVATSRLLGRFAAGAGDAQEITLGSGLTLDGSGVLTATVSGAQPLDATLTALAGVTTSANTLAYFTGVDTAASTPLTPFARTLLDDADQAAAQTTLGVVPGTHVQPLDATLTALAGVTTGADRLAFFTGVDTATTTVLTPFMRSLLDDPNQAAAQATLGVTPGGGATPGGSSGQVQYNNAGSFGGSSALTLDATTLLTLAPLTTKGDVLVQGSTTPVRLPVGTNGQVLTADSAAASGVTWAAPTGGGSSEWTRVDNAVGTLTTGLLAFWRMEETSGNRVDSVASMALVPQGGATFATGKHGNAAKTTGGAGAYFSIADNATLSVGAAQNFTIACWVQFDSLPANDNGIVGKGNVTANYDDAEFMLWRRTSTLRFSVASGTVITDVNSGITPTTGTWYFVIGWLDAANNLAWIQVNNGTPVSIACPNDSWDSAGPFEVGRQPGWSVSPILDGRVDDVMFYKRILTAAERTALWNSGLGLDYAELGSGATFLHPTITTDVVLAGSNVLTSGEPLESAGGIKLGTTSGTTHGVLRWTGSDFEGRKAGAWVSLITPTVSATDRLLGRVSAGAGPAEEIACTPAGRALLDDADAAAQRTTLGLGTLATQDASAVAITGGSAALSTVEAGQLACYGGMGVGVAAPAGTGMLRTTGPLGVQQVPSAAMAMYTAYDKTTQWGLVLLPTGSDTGKETIVFQNVAGTFVGSITTTATTTAYNTTSDARLKTEVQPLTGALDVVRRLRPITHRWRGDGSPGVGFVAQEVAQVVDGVTTGEPEAVDAEGQIVPMGMDPSKLVVWLVGACQDLAQQVQALTARLEAAGA